jgi:uncharacterized protein (TIGR02246 family)
MICSNEIRRFFMNFKPLLIVILSAALVGVSLAQTKPAASPSGGAGAEIKARSDAFAAAWNKHDPKAMAAMWATDGDLIDPFGASAKGRAEVEKFFTTEHTGDGRMAGTTYTITSQTSRMIRADVAIAEWESTITGMKNAEGKDAGPLVHHVTVVMSKNGSNWMIEAARPVIYAAPPGRPKPLN